MDPMTGRYHTQRGDRHRGAEPVGFGADRLRVRERPRTECQEKRGHPPSSRRHTAILAGAQRLSGMATASNTRPRTRGGQHPALAGASLATSTCGTGSLWRYWDWMEGHGNPGFVPASLAECPDNRWAAFGMAPGGVGGWPCFSPLSSRGMAARYACLERGVILLRRPCRWG